MESFKNAQKTGNLLVIDGGGMKIAGCAIGALKVLDKYFKTNNIKIDRVVGISGGAVIASLYALGNTYAQISKLILYSWTRRVIFDFNPFFFFGLLKGDRIEEFFKKGFQNKLFSETKIPLSILASRAGFFSIKSEFIENGYVHEATRASISIPLIFKPKKINRKSYFDGEVAMDGLNDIINRFHPREIYYIGIRQEQATLFERIIKVYNYFFKNRSFFLKKMTIGDQNMIHKIIIPITSHIRLWQNEHLPLLILSGEKVANNYLKTIKK
jgi:NTE family protein